MDAELRLTVEIAQLEFAIQLDNAQQIVFLIAL